jgi:hypothetical protein
VALALRPVDVHDAGEIERASDFQSRMILPTGLFEAFKHLLVSPLISPITRLFVSFPAVFLCSFPPGLTTGFLRNFTRNVIREIVVDCTSSSVVRAGQ